MQALRETQRRADVPPLVPARMLNEHTYCPRLAYLEWVQGDFPDSADTVEGRFHHRNVDEETGALPAPDELAGARFHARSVMLSAPGVGLVARIDLIEADGDVVTPIEATGTGTRPPTPPASPSMIIDGPIEARTRSPWRCCPCSSPSMIIDGPIEATRRGRCAASGRPASPSMIIDGPIEATAPAVRRTARSSLRR